MTEKDYNPEQRNKNHQRVFDPATQQEVGKKVMDTQKVAKPDVATPAKVSKEPNKKIAESQSDSENKEIINKKDSEASVVKDKADATKKDVKKKPTEKPKVKKSEAIVNGAGLPLSTKTSVAICKFIKGKNIPKAIADLEQVIVKKKAVPMKGEIPHRKGKIMSGRFPKNASESFIRLLKNLQANANANGLDEPIITEAMANIASQPYGKFGRVRKKRSHVLIKAKEKKMKKGAKK